jgi:hypothetical protein
MSILPRVLQSVDWSMGPGDGPEPDAIVVPGEPRVHHSPVTFDFTLNEHAKVKRAYSPHENSMVTKQLGASEWLPLTITRNLPNGSPNSVEISPLIQQGDRENHELPGSGANSCGQCSEKSDCGEVKSTESVAAIVEHGNFDDEGVISGMIWEGCPNFQE